MINTNMLVKTLVLPKSLVMTLSGTWGRTSFTCWAILASRGSSVPKLWTMKPSPMEPGATPACLGKSTAGQASEQRNTVPRVLSLISPSWTHLCETGLELEDVCFVWWTPLCHFWWFLWRLRQVHQQAAEQKQPWKSESLKVRTICCFKWTYRVFSRKVGQTAASGRHQNSILKQNGQFLLRVRQRVQFHFNCLH